jgi:hypothetical protein
MSTIGVKMVFEIASFLLSVFGGKGSKANNTAAIEKANALTLAKLSGKEGISTRTIESTASTNQNIQANNFSTDTGRQIGSSAAANARFYNGTSNQTKGT